MCTGESKAYISWALKKKKSLLFKNTCRWSAASTLKGWGLSEGQGEATSSSGGGALATTTTSQRPVSDDPHLMGNVSTTVNFRRRSAVSNHHLSLLTPTQIYYWQYFFWPETEASQKMWGKVRASVAQGNIVLWIGTEKINCCNCN